MRDIVVFVSPASAGKDYILNKCVDKFKWHKVVSHTTRIPRLGEKNGKDYWFVNPLEFNELEASDKFIETTSYKTTTGTWNYGFHKDSMNLEGIKCLIVNPHGLDQFIKKGYGSRLIIAYVVAQTDIRINRYNRRLGENPTEHQLAEGFLRLLRDIDDFDKFDSQLVRDRWIGNLYYYKNVPLSHIINNDENQVDYEISELLDFINEVNTSEKV